MTGRVIDVLSKGVSPAGVIFVMASWFSGFFLTFFGDRPDIKNGLLYKYSSTDNLNVYGITLLIGATIVIFGLLKPNRLAIQIGSMLAFLCYVYGGTLYATHGFWYPFFVSSLPFAAIYAYFFLAAQFARNLPRD